MSTGLQIFNASGVLLMDSQSITWNFIGAGVQAANTSGSYPFDTHGLLSEFQVFRSMIDAAPDNQEAIAHSASVSGNVLNVSGGNINTLVVLLGR